MTREFYSNGKLLISGEYAILDGAEGWAIPTKFGQHLKVTANHKGLLSWTSIDADGHVWFEASYSLIDLRTISTSTVAISNTLLNILEQTKKLQPTFLNDYNGCEVVTELSFPRNWGLGTSSTLINNVAQWARVDPYALLKQTFGGSGYDIACAQNDLPILFKLKNKKPIVQVITPRVPFSDQLYFVYLNQKKNSRDAIAAYRKQEVDKTSLIAEITKITKSLYRATSLKEFETLVNLHEEKLSTALKLPTIKETLFKDYPGSIKSLGGWGGDFVMVTGKENTHTYFKEKGYTTILPYLDMVL